MQKYITLRDTKESFIKKGIAKYGDKYSYGKVEYVNSRTKVIITCCVHGDFEVRPSNFLQGNTCRVCKEIVKQNTPLDKDYILDKFYQVQGDTYDYSLVGEIYSRDQEIDIICPSHGAFRQKVKYHLRKGQQYPCPLCRIEANTVNFPDFVSRARKVHGSIYEYVEEGYNGVSRPVGVICPDHGEFSLLGYVHLSGQGCKLCRSSMRTYYYSDSDNITYLYLLLIEDGDERYFKLGISVNVWLRATAIEKENPTLKVNVLYAIEMKATQAYHIEKSIHSSGVMRRYWPKVRFRGFTECYHKSELSNLLYLIHAGILSLGYRYKIALNELDKHPYIIFLNGSQDKIPCVF